jgi:excinuclease UvrABC helicase subunit UvrB
MYGLDLLALYRTSPDIAELSYLSQGMKMIFFLTVVQYFISYYRFY